MNWFLSAGSRPQAPVRLFCLPYAGGGASVFRRWQQGIGPDVEVLPVQLPGRENRIGEDARFDIADVAAAIASRADRPYAIYGHSMGGRVGFEVVRELLRTGAPLPLRLYVGGARAPHVTAASLFDGLSKVDDDELLRRLGDGGGLPAELLEHPELVELLLPLLRADFGRVDSYRYVPGEPLPVPIVVFSGRHDRAVTREHSLAWAEHTAAGFTLHEIDGGHFFLLDQLAELLAALRTDLAAAVAADRADPAPPSATAASSVAVDVPAAHRVPLGDTNWSVWRDAILRGTGFPADGLTLFHAPCAAAAADELLATGTGEDRFDKEFDEAVRAAAHRISELAADPLLREAVTWQNPSALIALDGLLRSDPEVRNKPRRKREIALLKYWQRYAGKNETVGFFGPSCWATVDPGQPEAARISQGPGLTRRRWVWFESWALTAYADTLGADPAVRRWWPPMLGAQLSLRDRAVLRPGRPPVPLSVVEAALLAAIDGRRPARELVTDPAIGLRRPEDGYALLDRLVARELITWDAALPVSPDAEQVLTGRIEAIGDEPLRAAARAGWDRLRAARDEVAAAAGDPDRLRAALEALNTTFTELTGAAPRQRNGQMYAGRTICCEDTSRELDVVFGAPLLADLAAPLDVLLRAARWMVAALAEAYGKVFQGLYEELRAEAGDAPVLLSDLWFLVQGLFWGVGERPVDAVSAEFAARWAGLFGLDALPADTTEVRLRVADLAERVDEVFPGARPDWSNAVLHSPDLQICATDADALRRGEYTVVLGELHAAWSSFDCVALTASHPDVERLRTALAADLGERRIRLLLPDGWPRRSSRTAHSLTGPTDRHLAFQPAPGGDPARVLPTVDLTVTDSDGRLVVTAPDGQRWPLTEVFAELLSAHAVDGFKLVAAAPYTPRITLDNLVVARQTWRTTVGESGLATAAGERENFLAVRAWRHRLGLPEQVYVKLGTETKPCFVDLASPAFANMFCAMVRAARVDGGDGVSLVVSEMLPTPDQAWVPDAAGRRYFSELRLQIVNDHREPSV
ncbi:thioesterase domain-containing protein [Micromonospora sp. NPDC006766]|uniref:thioesterase domain-containing protein n=1 Tax=Micromonospora sp. NPDC006766 TaxID=3154778 RepID=UPI0033D244B4